jgi:isocitrate lyase
MGSRPAEQHGRRNQEGVISMGAMGEQAALLQREWETDPRWAGITRHYSAQDVIRLRGGAAEEHSLARHGARRLWDLLHSQDAVRALGAVAGRHAGQIAPAERWLTPVVAEAGVGGALNAFELMKAMIEAGAAGVRFDDQLPAGGPRVPSGRRVLVPTGQHIETLTAARLAADVLDVPSLVIARTGARAASLLTSDIDERDHEFLTGERTAEGFYRVEPGLYACGTRALAFAPYADLLWLQAPAPDLPAARAFAAVIHSQYPDKLLAYSCAPSFSGRAPLDKGSAEKFRKELAAMGYRFQFIPLAGSDALDEPGARSADRYEHDDVLAWAQP